MGVAAGVVAWLISGFWLWYSTAEEERISFLWVSVTACVTTIVVGYIASIVSRHLETGIASL